MTEALLTLLFFVAVSFGFMSGLLIIVAYLLWADRKIWAAVQMRRGPNVVGPWGLFQSFADLIKFALKEVVIPDGANKGVFVIAPLVTASLALAAWAVVPVSEGSFLGLVEGKWVIADINVGILYLFARRLWCHHGWLGVELQVSLPVSPQVCRADGVLRSLHRLCDRDRAALCRLDEPHRNRTLAIHGSWHNAWPTGLFP
jgi:hypothetical protein